MNVSKSLAVAIASVRGEAADAASGRAHFWSEENYDWLVRLLLLYRWVTLLLPLFTLIVGRLAGEGPRGEGDLSTLGVFLAAGAVNLLLTVRRSSFDDMARRRPFLFGLDLLLMILFLAYTGGENSPYILHSFSPVFAAALFQQIRGGLLTAGGYVALLAAATVFGRRPVDPPLNAYLLITDAVGVFLTAALFGFVAQLLQRSQGQTERLKQMGHDLTHRNRQLEYTNQQLRLIQDLTLTLEAATDPVELQEQLLSGLVDELGFDRAVVALYEPDQGVLSGWLSRGGESSGAISHTAALPVGAAGVGITESSCMEALEADAGERAVCRAMRTREAVAVEDGSPPTRDETLNAGLALGECYTVLPMYLRRQPVGILIVDWTCRARMEEADLAALDPLSHHASVVLGSLRLCIGRAQYTAIAEERGRIAADIHDTVSQSLFGLAYGLNACTEMLPDGPEPVGAVKQQLSQMQPLVFNALQQIRSVIMDILPGELSRDRFVGTLHKHFSALALGQEIQLSVVVTPQFNRWPLEFRQQLLLITYEALANAARHAEAHNVSVQLHVAGDRLLLTVADDGIGFEPENTVCVPGVGLDSIRSRVESLCGELTITAAPGQGVYLQAQIPSPI